MLTHNTCLGGRERKFDPPAGLTWEVVSAGDLQFAKKAKNGGKGWKLKHTGEKKIQKAIYTKLAKTKISSQITFNSTLKANDSAEEGTWPSHLLFYLSTYKTRAGIYYVRVAQLLLTDGSTTLKSLTVKVKRLYFPIEEQRYKGRGGGRLPLPSLTVAEDGSFIDQITDCRITSHSILPQTSPLKRTLLLSL